MLASCSSLSDGAWRWHITQNTVVLINIHSAALQTQTDGFAAPFFTKTHKKLLQLLHTKHNEGSYNWVSLCIKSASLMDFGLIMYS